MDTLKKDARFAGLLYLSVTVFGIFAEFSVRANMIVEDNALATVNNIMANEMLFRFGFVSDIICQTSHLFLVLILYRIFKSIDQNAALLMLASVLISVSITFLNLLHQFAPLLILKGGDYMKVFNPDQLNALALFFLNLHKNGYTIAGVFFGLWLYPLGLLVVKSKYVPKVIGILLMIACFGYLIDFIIKFMYPAYPVVSYPGLAIAVIGELSFCFWILIMGMKVPKLEEN
jgi:hypothetical protein